MKTTRDIIYWHDDCDMEELTERYKIKWYSEEEIRTAINNFKNKINAPMDSYIPIEDLEIELFGDEE